jgi:HSP20 family protein
MNLIKKKSTLFPFIFDEFFKNNWDINIPQNSYSPFFNVKENDKEFVLELIVPGKNNEDFEIEIEKRLLSVSSTIEKEKSEHNYIIKEFDSSSFEKSFEIPYSIEIDKITSNYKNGILSITLPKRKEFQNSAKKTISVK